MYVRIRNEAKKTQVLYLVSRRYLGRLATTTAAPSTSEILNTHSPTQTYFIRNFSVRRLAFSIFKTSIDTHQQITRSAAILGDDEIESHGTDYRNGGVHSRKPP